MNLNGKTAFITGASSGIGKACAEQLAKLQCNLVLAARRFDKITTLSEELAKQYQVEVLPLALDVQDRKNMESAIVSIPNRFQSIDILINNAGLSKTLDPLQNANIDNWDLMIDTNIKGLLYITHAILPIMIKQDSGHIVNISSIAAEEFYPGGNVYSATKAAVHAISKSLRLDLLGKNIKVTEIKPGFVETEFSVVRFNDKDRAKQVYAGLTPLDANDVADSVIYAVTRKAHVNIGEILLTPVAQASCNHVYRNL